LVTVTFGYSYSWLQLQMVTVTVGYIYSWLQLQLVTGIVTGNVGNRFGPPRSGAVSALDHPGPVRAIGTDLF
jgi:hypothetical protein